VIFGAFTWGLIQDADDSLCRPMSFGERSMFESDLSPKEQVWTLLPSDFGTAGYFARRHLQIASHLEKLNDSAGELALLFELWLEPSWGLRQYLWAHREEDNDTARQVVAAIPGVTLIRIVEYLLGACWDRYLGWPALLAARNGELLFVEVKSSSDKFSTQQKEWIRGNSQT
jgi:hypothetical protein